MYLFMITQVFFLSEIGLNENASNSSFIRITPVLGVTYDDATAISYDVVKHPDNNFTIVLVDQIASNKKLGIISTTSNFLFEESIDYLVEDTADFSIIGKPSITYLQNSIYIAYPFADETFQGIKLLAKNLDTDEWINQTIFADHSSNYNSPLLMRNATNNGLIFVWQNDASNHYELFMSSSNTSVLDWKQEAIQISSFNESNNKECEFIMDSSNHLHFAWSYGASYHEKIMYRTVFDNTTLSPVENITDGSSGCRDPALVIDNYNYLNLFWTNHTMENPQTQYGTVNIHTAKKELLNGSWIDYQEAGPFIPFERPPSGESDAYAPAVAFDQQNRLWLAYEINEEYANHHGVDIRHRANNNWMPGTILSLINNPAKKPLLIVDDYDNVHCFWMDFRHSTSEIYHRIKFSTDTWSEEVLVTFTGKYFSYIWKTVLIVVIVFIVAGLPFVIANILRRKRAERLIKGKIEGLQ